MDRTSLFRNDHRYAPAVEAERAQAIARELVALRPTLILAQGDTFTIRFEALGSLAARQPQSRPISDLS
jgi:hypothetical protein